jgi:hypothetical protein
VIAALRRSFFENPLVGRQWATQLTGARLGAIYLLVTGVLLAADAITLGAILLEAPLLGLEGFAGSLLHFVNACVIYGLLVFLLPIRLAGAFDGPRLDRAFDQLVVTGLSPLRIHAGNWALGFLFALSLLLVSLPFQVYAYMLGGVPLERLITGYLCLAGVANVIIATALGLSVVEREWLAAPLTMVIFGLAGALACVLPKVFGSLAPLRSFLPEAIAMGFYRGAPGVVLADPVLFTARIPEPTYTLILWAVVMAPSIAWLLLGPSHRFLPGLNNFGNVVLPGDRRRKFLRRLRFALVRKVEVAFFYENRPRWLAAWEFPLRAAVGVETIVFLWAATIGLCFDGTPSVHPRLDFKDDGAVAAALGFTGGLLFIAVLWCADVRPRLAELVRVGRREWPRSAVMSLVVAALLGGYVAMHAALLRSAAPNLPALPARVWQDYQADWWRFVASLVLFLLNCHLLGKVLGPAIKTAGALRFLILLGAAAGLLGPLFIAGCIGERWLPRELYPLVLASPLIHYFEVAGSLRRDVFPPGFQIDDHLLYNVALQGGLAAALSLLLFGVSALRRSRRAAPAGAAVVLALVCAGSSPAPAQETESAPAVPPLPLQGELIHGFEGTFHQQEVDFYTLLLRNQGTETIEGRLWIDHGHSRTPSRPFVAPAGTATTMRWSEAGSYSIYWAGELVLEARAGQLRLPLPTPTFKGQTSRNGLASDFLVVEDKARWAGASSSFGEWTRARALCLPEDVRAYAGLGAVLIGPADLSRWSAGQRRALHDYVRLGGSVIFHGGIDRGSLQGAGEWAELIAPRASPAPTRGRAELVVEDFEDSRTLVWHDGKPVESALPLLTARPVGFGWVGHATCPPSDAVAGQTMMQELIDGLPRSSFPVALSGAQRLLLDLRDASSIFAVLGYFGLYVIGMGPVLIFGFRKKGRRRLLPLVVLLVPLAFVACLPALYASLHIRPSRGALTRVTCFGPGARRGTALAWLDVVSTGRQKHLIELTGEGLTAYHSFAPEHAYYSSSGGSGERTYLHPARLRGDSGSAALLDLELMPWGTRRALVVGDAHLAAPALGRALYDARSQKLSLQASGLDAFGPIAEGRVIVRLPGGEETHVAQVAAERFADGALTLDLSIESPAQPARGKSRGGQLRVGRPIIEAEWPSLRLPPRPYVYLGLLVDGGSPAVRTADIVFERELPAELTERGEPRLPERRLLRRDDRTFVSHERTLILQELPLEVR